MLAVLIQPKEYLLTDWPRPWRDLPFAAGRVPTSAEVASNHREAIDWYFATVPELEAITVADRFWWDFGPLYRRLSGLQRGQLVSVSDGLHVALMGGLPDNGGVREVRWRLHTGVVLAEMRNVADTIHDREDHPAFGAVLSLLELAFAFDDLEGFNSAMDWALTSIVVGTIWEARPEVERMYHGERLDQADRQALADRWMLLRNRLLASQ